MVESHEEEWLLQLEADVVPLRRIDHSDLAACTERQPDQWVVGSVHAPLVIEALRGYWVGHLNGVAFYRIGAPDFIEFVLDTWIPTLLLSLNNDDSFAYDMVTDISFSQMVANSALGQAWGMNSRRFGRCSQLINLSGKVLGESVIRSQISAVIAQYQGQPPPWLLHVHSSDALRIADDYLTTNRFLLDSGSAE